MTVAKKIWKITWRLGVCLLLLAWIFQAIFWDEGRAAWTEATQASELDWQKLTRGERFNIALRYGPPEVWRTLTSMETGPLVLSLILMGGTIFVGVIRWQLVLKVHGLDMPLARTTQISLVAHFFNSFLLGSVGGDVLKAYYVARETKHKKTEAVVTVLVDRLIGLFSMLVFACVMLIPNLPLLRGQGLRNVLILTIAMTAGCAIVMFLFFRGGVSKRIPKAREYLRRLPKGEMIESSLEAFREFGRHRGFWARIIPVAALANIITIAHFWSLTQGFNLNVSPLALAAIVPTVTSIASLPITPSGLGVRENLYVHMLHGVGVEPSQALLLSLIGFGTSLAWSIIGGLVYLTQRDKQHLEEIEQEAARDPSP